MNSFAVVGDDVVVVAAVVGVYYGCNMMKKQMKDYLKN